MRPRGSWSEPAQRAEAPGGDSVIVTPLRLVALLVRRWRLVVAVPFVTAAVACALTVLIGGYTARSRFAPQLSGGDLGAMAGLAASLRIPVAGGSAESIDFYVDLLSSSEILRDALVAEYRFHNSRKSSEITAGTLLDILEIEGDTEDERLQNGIDLLREQVVASANQRSGLITLETNAKWAELAEGLNRTVLDLLSRFDRDRRQGRAKAEREFVEGRLEAARLDLQNAEGTLAAFLDRNRRPYQSPRLTMELERRQRQVILKQQVYASLAQSYEEARIEEVRNTPIFTIVDHPEGSARGSKHVVLTAVLGLALGAVFAIGWIVAADYLTRQTGSQEYLELRSSLSALRSGTRVEEPA